MLNVSLLLEELTRLTVYPDKWGQGDWAKAIGISRPSACGSRGCLAGNTVIYKGMELDWHQHEFRTELVDGIPMPIWIADNVTEEYGGESIRYNARKLLGLTTWQADKLFDGDNSRDELWAWAEKISAGEINGNHYYQAKLEAEKQRRLESIEDEVQRRLAAAKAETD